ncbi:hypothetical protein [Streptomyces acidiscabies]
MTRPRHTRPNEARRRRAVLGAAYLSVLVTLVVALVWGIASGGSS